MENVGTVENPEIVADWAAENRAVINRWVEKALKRFWEDASVRGPRAESERRNGLEVWLEQQRLKLSAGLQEEFPQEFSPLASGLPPAYITRVFDELVWPEVKPEVQRYAIFGFCAAWIGRHMGDATTLGTPKCDGPPMASPYRRQELW